MKIIQICAAIAAAAIILTGTPVFAASCSSLEAECIGYGGSSNTTTPEAKRRQCQASCKAQCLKGVKTYVSPFTGKQYVVDSCK